MRASSPLPVDSTVLTYAHSRGIREILHFTTNKGGLGIFSTGSVLCRDRLEQHQYIEYIYTPNCANRLKDAEWTGYVNLSISRVNSSMFGYASNRWHSTEDLWWIVLGFDPAILAHPNVVFATTNNTYRACVKRDTGMNGLEALFAPSIEWGWRGSVHTRTADTPSWWTTDPQAEVLYPDNVDLQYLRAVYVRDPDHIDTVRSWFGIFQAIRRVPVAYKPEVFNELR